MKTMQVCEKELYSIHCRKCNQLMGYFIEMNEHNEILSIDCICWECRLIVRLSTFTS